MPKKITIFADSCDVLPIVNNAHVRLTFENRTVTGANMTCYPGHRFQDGRQTEEVKCDVDDGHWSEFEECRSNKEIIAHNQKRLLWALRILYN